VNEQSYILMEFMNHGNVLNYLRENEKKLEEKNLFDITHQVCIGMEYLESKNIIHK